MNTVFANLIVLRFVAAISILFAGVLALGYSPVTGYLLCALGALVCFCLIFNPQPFILQTFSDSVDNPAENGTELARDSVPEVGEESVMSEDPDPHNQSTIVLE